MFEKKIFLLDAVKVNNRLLFPIVSLTYSTFDKLFINIDYIVLALKIDENENIYFKNIDLSEKEFIEIKKRFEESGI